MITNNSNITTIKRSQSDSGLIKLNSPKQINCYSKDDLSLTTKKNRNELSKDETIKTLKSFSKKINTSNHPLLKNQSAKEINDNKAYWESNLKESKQSSTTPSNKFEITSENSKEPQKNTLPKSMNTCQSFYRGVTRPTKYIFGIRKEKNTKTQKNMLAYRAGHIPGIGVAAVATGGAATLAAGLVAGGSTVAAIAIAVVATGVVATVAVGVATSPIWVLVAAAQ